LEIVDGGVVNVSTQTNAGLSIGEAAASDGSSVLVSGSGSQLNHLGTGRLSIGNLGGSVANPSVLTVAAGAHVSTANFYVADAAGSVASALVDGAGSRIDATTDVTIGDQGTGSATIQAGGVIASQNIVRIGGIQSGLGTATVTGAGSQLVAGTTLSVADVDSDGGAALAIGILNIASGGTAQSTGHTFIGRQGQNQGTVNVNSGGVLLSLASLYVGGSDVGAGGTGTLNINGGGSVSVTNELVIYNGDTVNLNAGGLSGLNLKTLTRNAGSQFNFTSGRLYFFDNDTNNRILNTAALTDIFNADHTITTGKTLQIGGPVTLSAPLRLNGGTFALESVKPGNEAAFAANLDWDSGTLQFTDSGLTVGGAGLFGPTLVMDADQTLIVAQTVTIDAGAELVVAGGLTSGGLSNIGDLVAVGATINGPVVNNTAVTVVGTVDFNGLVSGPGNFFGPGTANFNGGMAPGASPAEIGFEGNVALADTNTLFIEIAGTTPGSQYDRLVVAGDAALDGILDVSLVGFSPTIGQQFTVLTAGSIIDNGLALGGAAAGSFSLLVGSSSVILQAIAAGLPGDYNQNGTVDVADYVVWRNNDGTQAGYDTWRAHFGQTAASGSTAPGSAGGSSAAVPEPGTFLIALIFATNLPSFWEKFARRRRPNH
jgi:T5SS/PEP-CTERM-associated repeat protein